MFQALTGRPAEVGQGGALAESGMPHIDLGRDSEAIVIAPLTANTLAKIAHGLADNLLTQTVLASRCPLVVAPAMNTRMWENPITQENVARLIAQPRMILVGPCPGSLACGEEGVGRMAEPEDILAAVLQAVSPKDLGGRRLLVTAGPTREAWDPVRYLSNRSSGRMGYALAAAAARRGAEVVLVSGPSMLPLPTVAKRVEVTCADEMAKAVYREAKSCDAVLMAAAVADFRPKKTAAKKIKKGSAALTLELERTEDILAKLGRDKGRTLLVGFAAETGNPVAAAREKLRRKNLDLVVANDVSRPDAGFDVETNRVHLVDRSDSLELPLMSKAEVAERILDRVAAMLGKRKRK